MNTEARKLLSTLLMLTLVLGLFAAMPLTASAAGPYTIQDANGDETSTFSWAQWIAAPPTLVDGDSVTITATSSPASLVEINFPAGVSGTVIGSSTTYENLWINFEGAGDLTIDNLKLDVTSAEIRACIIFDGTGAPTSTLTVLGDCVLTNNYNSGVYTTDGDAMHVARYLTINGSGTLTATSYRFGINVYGVSNQTFTVNTTVTCSGDLAAFRQTGSGFTMSGSGTLNANGTDNGHGLYFGGAVSATIGGTLTLNATGSGSGHGVAFTSDGAGYHTLTINTNVTATGGATGNGFYSARDVEITGNGTLAAAGVGASAALCLAADKSITLDGSISVTATGGASGSGLSLSGTGKVIFTDDNQKLEVYNNSVSDEVINLHKLLATTQWNFDDNYPYITTGNGNASDITITLPASESDMIYLVSGLQYISTNAGALANGRTGTAYSATITAVPGTSCDKINYIDVGRGTLPPGLLLNYTPGSTSATITGTPSTAGTYKFTIYPDGEPSGGGGNWHSAPVQYSITINSGGSGSGGGSSTTNASITPIKADFDKNGGKDINVTLTKGSYTLQGLKNGSYTLKVGTDYTVNDNTVTIKAAYLKTLDVGEHSIIFGMSGGTDPILTVTVKDTTKPSYENSFTDVVEGSWYYGDVRYVYENELMTGTAADKFSPDSTLTRGMIVTILYRHAGEPDVSGLSNLFDDVTAGMWYTDAVKWAADNGIVSGYGNGMFGPNDNITRQDLAVILVRYDDFAGIGLSVTRAYPGFSDDAEIAGYAKSTVERLFKAGIINGKTGNLFDPQGQATRAETAAMLHRMLAAAGK